VRWQDRDGLWLNARMMIRSARPTRPLRLAIAGLLAGLVVAASPLTASASTYTVRMDGLEFKPEQRSVARGHRVRWTNDSGFDHDVRSTAPARYFSSGAPGSVAPGESYAFTFRSAGRFAYVCKLHEPNMSGSVTVPVTVGRLYGPARFRVTVATVSSSFPWRHQVQVQKPGSSTWVTISTTSATSVIYTPSKRGTHDFRSRVTNINTGADSGWSPVVSRTY